MQSEIQGLKLHYDLDLLLALSLICLSFAYFQQVYPFDAIVDSIRKCHVYAPHEINDDRSVRSREC